MNRLTIREASTTRFSCFRGLQHPQSFSLPVSGPFSVQWQRKRYRFLSATEQPSQA